MSVELDQYLEKQPIFQFRLVDGSTIIGKISDIDDSNKVHLEEAYQVHFDNSGPANLEIVLHKWMCMSDEKTCIINLNHIISHSELNTKAKEFYSKTILKTKVEALSSDLKSKESDSIFSEVVRSIIEGLDNQDYLDDYEGWDGYPKPWPPEEDI
tara:strand:+ start:746 stop:1210 length:465 start_codon:yes stop_codon:yes gene_type:complete